MNDTLTVKELIEQLNNLPENYPIYTYGCDGYGDPCLYEIHEADITMGNISGAEKIPMVVLATKDDLEFVRKGYLWRS